MKVGVRGVVGTVVVGRVAAAHVVVLRLGLLLHRTVLVVAVAGSGRRKGTSAQHGTPAVVVELPVVVILTVVLRRPATRAGSLRVGPVVLRIVALVVSAAAGGNLGVRQGPSPPVTLVLVPLAVAGHVAAVDLSVVVAVAEVPRISVVDGVARPVWKGRGRQGVVRLGRQVVVSWGQKCVY